MGFYPISQDFLENVDEETVTRGNDQILKRFFFIIMDFILANPGKKIGSNSCDLDYNFSQK